MTRRVPWSLFRRGCAALTVVMLLLHAAHPHAATTATDSRSHHSAHQQEVPTPPAIADVGLHLAHALGAACAEIQAIVGRLAPGVLAGLIATFLALAIRPDASYRGRVGVLLRPPTASRRRALLGVYVL